MVRLTDLPEYERQHLLEKSQPPLGPAVWVENRTRLADKRIALLTTAGLHFEGDDAFGFVDAGYRVIPGDEDPRNLLMSHSSANFDRGGFQQDVNLVFPLERFRELVARGEVGSLASAHYSLMGAGLPPEAYEGSVRGLAGMLKKDRVDAVFLTPV